MTAAGNLTLYVDAFFISPYAFSSFVALKEKKLPFELKTVALHDRAQHAPDYRDASLTGRVPSLRHDAFWLSESSAIDEYLEESFPPPKHPPLYPADPKQRARARQVQAWLRSDLAALRTERSTTTMFYEHAKAPLSSDGQADAEKLCRITGQILSGGAKHLFGDWCIADSELAFMLMRLVCSSDPVPGPVREYAERIWSRPSSVEWVKRERIPLQPY